MEVSDAEVREAAVRIVGREIIKKGRNSEELRDTKLNAVYRMLMANTGVDPRVRFIHLWKALTLG